MTDDRPVVLITGAGSGLGLASALFLAARNFRVYGTALTAAEEQELREQAARRNVEVSAQRMDVTRRADIDGTVDTIVREADGSTRSCTLPAWDCAASSKISACRRSAGFTTSTSSASWN